VKVADLLPSALAEARAVGSEVATALLGFAHRAVVEADAGTSTLSISPEGRRYRIRVSPGFCDEQVRDRRDALAVLAHELLHAFRGHFELPPERHPFRRDLQNVALDVLVNAIVWARFVPRGAGLFARLYPADVFPVCLLRPPVQLLAFRAPRDATAARLATASHAELVDGWQPGSALRPRLELAFRDHYEDLGLRQPGALARLHLDGWLLEQEPQGYWERFRRLVEAELGVDSRALDDVVLLGDHEARRGDVLRSGGPPGLGGLRAARQAVTPSKVPSREARRFYAEVRKLADKDPSARTARRRPVAVRSVVPRPGRRELPALALGAPPPFYSWTTPLDVDEAAGIRVYLDVSGSTRRLQALFLGLASTLGDSLVEPVWAWSAGEPVSLTRADIRRGEFRTRHGTEVDAALEHALGRGYRRVLVMTDGEFSVGPTVVDRVRRSRVEVTFLLEALRRSPFCDRAALERLGSVIDVPRNLS